MNENTNQINNTSSPFNLPVVLICIILGVVGALFWGPWVMILIIPITYFFSKLRWLAILTIIVIVIGFFILYGIDRYEVNRNEKIYKEQLQKQINITDEEIKRLEKLGETLR